MYAAVAVVGGAALAGVLEPAAGPLRVASAVVLLVIAALTAAHAWATAGTTRQVRPIAPARAYLLFLGITAVNPTTVACFAAVVLGNRDLVSSALEGLAFVVAAFAASASWQLVLAAGGAALGALGTGHRGRLVSGLVSAAVIAGLAFWTLLG